MQLKEKMKLLQAALTKERADKLKLSKALREVKIKPDIPRPSLSPIPKQEESDARLSFRKTVSLNNPPFNFSEEKTHRNTLH